MLRSPRPLVALLLLAAAAPPVFGQSGQYNAPGSLGRHPVDTREALRNAMDDARWRVGPVRLDPWIGLQDAAWVKNRDEKGDFTASIGAGLRAYLPVGSRVIFTAEALPSYIWWRDRSEDSRVGGRAGLGMFLNSNRFGLELRATSSDLDDYVTPEVQRRTPTDSKTISARLDVPLGWRLALFASGSRTDVAVDDPDPAFSLLSDLDRTTSSVEGGLRVRLGNDLTLDLGAGTSETTFEDAARDRSNDGGHTIAALAWTRPKLGASVAVRRFDLSGTVGSEFETFDGTTWQGQISWAPRRGLGLGVYGQRELLYSVATDAPYFLDRRVGLRVGLPLGSRISVGLFVEEGEHEYADERREDVSSWGGSLGVPLVRRVRLDLAARNTTVDGVAGRVEIRELGLRISLGGGPSWN